MEGLEDFEGTEISNYSEGLQNEGMSDAQREYMQEVIPDSKDWLNMTYEEKLDSVNLMEVRLDEMQFPLDAMPHEYFECVSDLKQLEQFNNIDCIENCIITSDSFYSSGLSEKFMEGDIETRELIAQAFFDEIKADLGLDPDIPLEFCEMDSLGGYSPGANCITLNESYLEHPDPRGLLKTIVHESEHAFQQQVVDNPDLYPDVSSKAIAEWTYNMEHYKDVENFGFEEYRNQPVEKDAFAFESYVFAQVDKLKNLRD